MLKITDKNFLTIIKELDSLTEWERVLFFSEQSPDKFLLWWFYYYHEDFITPLADFHYDWIESLISWKDVFIEWFRGSIKTSITLAVVCYFITLKKYRFIVWQSYESTSSTRNTTQIALKLMNKKLERDYGVLFSLKGGNEDLEKKSVGEFDTRNGIKVLSASLGEKIRGAISKNTRPELLILDDIDVTDSVKNPDIIQKNYDKITSETFGAMSKTNAKIIFLGNTINQDWVVPRFRKEKKGIWDVYHQPLIVEWLIQWEFFTQEMINWIIDKEWERAYNQNYLLKPIDIYAVGLIKQEDLRYYDHVSLDDFTEVYIHADTTHTWKTTSDYFACGVIGMSNKDKNFYLLDFILEKMDVEKQARSCISLYSKYDTKVKKMTYDEKSNQWFGFWIKKLAKEEYNISLPIQDLKYPNDKVTHFEPHVPHFKANRVFLPKNHNRINVLTDQVLAFPTKWVNDDAIDMISGCLDNYNIKKKKVEFFTI